MATVGSRDTGSKRGSLKTHVLSYFVLMFVFHREGLPDGKTSPPMAACICLSSVARVWSAGTSRMMGILG